MKLRLLVLFLVFSFSVSAETLRALSPAEEVLNKAVADRMNYLEHRYHIRFDRAAFKGATFGIPAEHDQTFEAEYVPGESRIYVNRSFVFWFVRTKVCFGERAFEGVPQFSRSQKLLTILDHELGHFWADHVSRKIGNGAWPSPYNFSELSWDQQCGLRVLTEGVAGYFSYTTPDYNRKERAKSFPEESDAKYWYGRGGQVAFYAGGYWLVRPILQRFREKGVEYIVTHPFYFEDGDARQAAKEYQRTALAELGKKRK